MTESQSIRAAIYTRKSTNHNLDLETNSIEAQRQYGEAFIAAHAGEGWEVVEERYDDAAVSGATADRPALNRLLADAKEGRFQVVVCYKLDRISRNLRDFLDITETLQGNGVRLACVAHPIDTGTAAGRAFVNLMAVFGQLEREQGAERVRDKIAAVRRKGGYIGGVTPFGYIAKDKRLVPDPERRDAVGRIYECFLRTGSAKAVAASLVSQGVTRRDGRPWNIPYISHILRNRLYAGEIEFEGKVVESDNDPLVPKPLWEAVASLIREHREARDRRPDRGRQASHPLAGLVRCGLCGSAMTASATRGRHGNGKVYCYFSCRADSKRPDFRCGSGRIPGGALEKVVLDRIGDVLRSPVLVSHVAEALELPPAEVIRKLENVTEFWAGLFPAEKWRLLHLLVGCVTVLPDEVSITIRTQGVASVIEEIRHAD